MGLSPREVKRLSVWELSTAIRGWNEAHEDPNAPPPPMSDDDARELGII